MTKYDVMKALEVCGDTNANCNECPYDKTVLCDQQMCKDALALLSAHNESPKPKYTCATIFTKKGNLSDYLYTDKIASQCNMHTPSESMREFYAREREIELILLTRHENGKLICRIKCPVNPLPVKGEFEAPTFSAVQRFLIDNGWRFKQKLYPHMFE